MEIKQLEYFLAVAKELHFTKAAEKLGISQPSLSQHIRALEYEVGTPLFDRIGKKTALTEAGKILAAHSHKVFHELEQARFAINELAGLQRGALVIGSLLTVANYLLPPAALSFHKQYPDIELSILGLRTGDIRTGLLQNELDFGIVSLPMDDEELESIPLFTEELALAVAAGHDLAKADSLSVAVLNETPAILLPENFYLRKLINGYCEEKGFRPRPIFEMSVLESLINMVAEGAGVTVLPRPYLEHLHNEKIRIVPLVDPTPTRDIGILFRRDKYMCAATREFIRLLTDRAATWNRAT